MATEPRAIRGNNSGSAVTYTEVIIGVNGLMHLFEHIIMLLH